MIRIPQTGGERAPGVPAMPVTGVTAGADGGTLGRMSTPLAEQVPEAAGPGVYAPDGSVTYGGASPPRVVVEPPTAREPGQPANIVPEAQCCPACQGIPPALLAELRRALAAGARR